MAAVAGCYGIGGPEDRSHQRRRNQKEAATHHNAQTPDGVSDP